MTYAIEWAACIGHAYQLKLATILGQVNAMQWIIPIIVLMLSLATSLFIDIPSLLRLLPVIVSVCLSICCFCCMLANKIIDKTNHLRGKSLRPHPIVLGSTASWLTRNMYETIWRQRKQYKTETKIKQKSQQNVPKTYSLYICIYGIYRNNSIIVTGSQAGYANATNIPKLQEVHLFGHFNRSEN